MKLERIQVSEGQNVAPAGLFFLVIWGMYQNAASTKLEWIQVSEGQNVAPTGLFFFNHMGDVPKCRFYEA